MHTQFSWNLLSTPTVSPVPSASGLLGFLGTATSRWWGPANHTFLPAHSKESPLKTKLTNESISTTVFYWRTFMTHYISSLAQ